MTDDRPTTTRPPAAPHRITAQITAALAGLTIVLLVEAGRLGDVRAAGGGVADWLAGVNLDTTLPLLLFLLLPLFWRIRGDDKSTPKAGQRRWFVPTDKTPLPRADARTWLLCLAVGTLSLAASVWVAARFGNLPPAYHDEYSYLFQAQTFLAGRTWFPSHDMPRLFDQVHVLNEGRFASRYFPGTGLWMMPFVALDHPYLGHWVAGALATMLFFWAGRELGGDGVGLLAGGLIALAPGMILFSNLLLAHHPTLVGLGLFLFGFLRWFNRGGHWPLLAAGAGLAFAMLCRPMTAAGIGLPFGVYFAAWLIRGARTGTGAPSIGPQSGVLPLSKRCLAAALLGGPLVVGLVANAAYSRSITGSLWLTPYQQYTEIYTPRHLYGFNNADRGARLQGDRVIRPVTRNYDLWAENLTPRLAAHNAYIRLVSSLQWTLGLVPLAIAGVAFLFLRPGWQRGSWLILAAIGSLHLAHVPYWFAGILGYHYVFESGPLWLLLFAMTTAALLTAWRSADRPAMPVWWGCLAVAAILVNLITVEPFWSSRLAAGIGEVAFSRQKHAAFDQLIATQVDHRPAVVLVEHDPADRHIDYVNNPPSLQGSVLIARYDAERHSLDEAAAVFPGRHVYLLRIGDKSFMHLRGPISSKPR